MTLPNAKFQKLNERFFKKQRNRRTEERTNEQTLFYRTSAKARDPKLFRMLILHHDSLTNATSGATLDPSKISIHISQT